MEFVVNGASHPRAAGISRCSGPSHFPLFLAGNREGRRCGTLLSGSVSNRRNARMCIDKENVII